MKHKRILFILLVVIVAFGVVVKLNYTKPLEPTAKPDVDLSFAVLSDIHNSTGAFKNSINDLYGINSYMDALVLNGDSVDEGLEEQYNDIKDVLSKKSEILPDTIIKNIGNHEYYNYSVEVKNEEYVQDKVKKYLEFSGNEKIYNKKWINGYHFISLGSDNIGVDNVNASTSYISQKQINWLKESLAEGYEKGKPIFLFLHQPLDMNFFSYNYPGSDRNEEIKGILAKYPEVILFTSHSHLTPYEDLNRELSFEIINTGSVSSNYVTDEKSEKGFKKDNSYSNGIYVEVKDNKVTIKGRNFKDNSWIYTKEISY